MISNYRIAKKMSQDYQFSLGRDNKLYIPQISKVKAKICQDWRKSAMKKS